MLALLFTLVVDAITKRGNETYVGGKPRKSNHKDDDDKPNGTGTGNKRGRGTSKTPVVGIDR